MKKTVLVLAIVSGLIVSLVLGAQFVDMTKANPYAPWEVVDPIPGTIPPRITVASPENNTEYSGFDLNVMINVTGPQTPYPTKSGIMTVQYVIDNAEYQDVKLGWDLIPEVNYSKVLYDGTVGTHKLTVTALGVVEPGENRVFFVETASTVFYTRTAQPTPTSTGTPKVEPFPTTLVVVSVIAVVAVVGLGLLVYLKKRQKDKSA